MSKAADIEVRAYRARSGQTSERDEATATAISNVTVHAAAAGPDSMVIMRHLLTALALTSLLGACGDDSASGSSDSGGASSGTSGDGGAASSSGKGSGNPTSGPGAGGDDAAGAGGDSTGPSSPTTTTTTGGGGAPPCTADTLAEAVRVVSVDGAVPSGSRAVTSQAGSGSVVGWVGADGIHITPLDAVDARAGADVVVEGTQIYGVAATETDAAVLVSRAPDYMTFIRVDRAGTELARADLVGGGDHATQGVEWFGEFAQTGRLVRQGDGTYAAYHALHRRWPDNIGHQGDTLRFLDASGAAVGGGWDWGCSHSMDQRLAYGPGGLVPICIADCYPGKGIYFNHQSAMLTDDPAANCAGGFTTLLGGLVSITGGFALVYQDDTAVAHLGLFDTAGTSTSDRVLDVAGSSRLAAYDGGLLLGAQGGAGASITRLDAAGVPAGDPADVAAGLPDQDFEGRADGEVAWATASSGSLSVVRVRVCE